MFHIGRPVFVMLILIAISMLMSFFIYPYVLKIARQKNLVDNPSDRKLQKQPVPVMGGLVVFFGIVVALCFFKTTVNYINLFSTLCGMMVLLYIGTMDDIIDIRAWTKFIVEILVCLLILYGTRSLMNNFQGLFGIDILPVVLAIPLTTFAMVGIINSINLIDGVDGLASGMSIFILGVFALYLFLAHEYSFCALAVICAGALIPFFIYNVFSKDSKMYLGDGGALMVGVAIASVIVNILKGKGPAYSDFVPDFQGISLISFCLATVSIPVFDTLRVMIGRVLRGIPPFHADKTHLHHILLSRGLSHFQVTLAEIGLDALVVISWIVSVILGAGIGVQFAVVLVAGVMVAGLLPLLFRKKVVD